MVGKGAPEVRLVACILHEALNKSPDCKSYGLPTLSEYSIGPAGPHARGSSTHSPSGHHPLTGEARRNGVLLLNRLYVV